MLASIQDYCKFQIFNGSCFRIVLIVSLMIHYLSFSPKWAKLARLKNITHGNDLK